MTDAREIIRQRIIRKGPSAAKALQLVEDVLTNGKESFHQDPVSQQIGWTYVKWSYICTFVDVASQMQTEEGAVSALLYGVIKYTRYTCERALIAGYSKEAIEPIKILVADKYADEYNNRVYFERVKKDPIARQLKIEDLMFKLEHMDAFSRSGVSDFSRERFLAHALNYLREENDARI